MWTVLRQKDLGERESIQTKVLPITIRSYETLIRLSTAHAKLRQSSSVELYDCVEGFRLMVFCLYGSEDALDDDLKQILRENNLEVVWNKDIEAEKPQTAGKNQKKDNHKKEE